MAETVKITIVKPGAVAIGDYKRGQVYEVDAKEAERLVRVKGFEVVEKQQTQQTGN